MKGLFKNIHTKIERWLHREEYEAYEAQEQLKAQRSQNIDPEKAQKFLDALKEEYDAVVAQIEIIEAEDHSQPPTEEDIARYYTYHQTLITNLKKMGAWTVSDRKLIEESEYHRAASEQGWVFLRDSCDLPIGSLKEPQAALWSTDTTPPKWDDSQKWDSK